MRPVAIRFIRRVTEATECNIRRAIDGFAGAGDNFDGTGHEYWAVLRRLDFQRTIALYERIAFLRRDFAARTKSGSGMAAIAIRFVARCATAAQRGAERRWLADNVQLAMERQRPVLAHTRQIDLRRMLVGTAIQALITAASGAAASG